MFISVDLPAPFSPTMACTVPRRTVRWMLSLATTPGNLLVMPTSSTAISPAATCGAAGGLTMEEGPFRHESAPDKDRARSERYRVLARARSVVGDDFYSLLGTVILPSMIC